MRRLGSLLLVVMGGLVLAACDGEGADETARTSPLTALTTVQSITTMAATTTSSAAWSSTTMIPERVPSWTVDLTLPVDAVLREPDEVLLRAPWGDKTAAVGRGADSGACCFAAGGGIAVIVDSNNHRLHVYDERYEHVASYPLPFSGVLGVAVDRSSIVLAGSKAEPGGQWLQFARLDPDAASEPETWSRTDMQVYLDLIARDDGSVWAADIGQPVDVWKDIDGTAESDLRPLPDGSSAATRFDGRQATVRHVDEVGETQAVWSFTPRRGLILAELTSHPQGLLAVLVVPEHSNPNVDTTHRAVVLGVNGAVQQFAFETVYDPYYEITGAFQLADSGRRLLRLRPTSEGVEVVAYDLNVDRK